MAKYIHLSQNLSLEPGHRFDNTNWDQSWYFGSKYRVPSGDTFPEINNILDGLKSATKPELLKDVENFHEILKDLLIGAKFKSELLKEFLFEDVRKRLLPNGPSRVRCSFFSPAEIDLNQVCAKYGFKNSDRRTFYLLEDDCDSNITFSADPDFLNCNNKTPQEILTYAEKYWQGEKSGEIQEILAVGKFKVLRKLDWP